MDVHDGLGNGGEQTMWEPPGFEEANSSTTTDDGTPGTSGYDGSGGGYDDSTGQEGSAAGGDSGGDHGESPTPPDGAPSSGTMTVEVEGQTRELPAEKDYTGDGRPDAVTETGDGRVIVFADTEDNATGAAGPDGKADEAYVVDKQTGRVVGAAHIDPDSGAWVEGADTEGPSAVGSGDGTGSGDPGTGSGDPGTGSGGTGDGGDPTAPVGDEPPAGTGAPQVVTVESDGHEIGVAATIDTDGDGRADSGVIYADGRAVVLTSTDDDPAAEQVAVVDPETGRVVQVAHVDPRTGEWEEGPAPRSDGGTDTTGGTGTDTTGGTGTGTDTTGGTGSGSGGASDGTMTVELGGEIRELPAERDYTGDGRPDAATETGDGRVIVFADTEDNATGAAGPDGKADEAWIVDKQTGRVVGAAHVDPRTGEWVEGADTDGSPSVGSSSGSTGGSEVDS